MKTPFDGLPGIFTGALGRTVTVMPSLGLARQITAIFTARSQDEEGIVQPVPALHARSDDVTDLADGDEIQIDGRTYVVRTPRPDGQGMTTLILSE